MEKQVKKVSKLKLNQLSKVELEQRAMKNLLGGSTCSSHCTRSWAYSAWQIAYNS